MSAESEQRRAWVRRLFDVRTAAVVGASEKGALTRCLIDNLTRYGISDSRLMLVNPKRSTVHGLPAHASLDELPVVPDLTFALVGPQRVEDVARQVAAIGGSVLAVATGGYAEAGEEGRARQERLRELSAKLDLPVLGPNTLGYIAPAAGVGAWTGRVARPLQRGPVAIAAQSSGILNMVLELAAYRHLGVHSALSVGNEATVDLADLIGHLAADPGVRVLALVLEGTVAPRALAEALVAARAAGKDIVVLKFGNSEIGRRNIETHSGRLGTGKGAWSALFKKVGAVVVDDIDQFLNAAAALTVLGGHPEADARDPLLLTVSGGDCGLLADISETVGLSLAALSPETGVELAPWDERLRHRAPSNPLDFGSFENSDDEARRSIAAVAMADPGVGTVLVRLVLPWTFDETVAGRYRGLAAAAREAGRPLLAMTEAAEFVDEAWFAFFEEIGVPLLTSYTPTLTAMQRIVESRRRSAAVGRLDWAPDAVPAGDEGASGDAATTVPLGEAVGVLRRWEVPYVESGIVTTPAEAGELAGRLGLPVCVKGMLPDVVHKAKAGYVAVGVDTAADVVSTCEEWRARAETLGQAEELRFEVQRMVAADHEVFVGMWRDPVMGPVLTVGRGGVNVEQLRDITYLLPPVAPGEVVEALAGLSGPLGVAGADLDALVDVVGRIGALVASEEGRRILQLDVNPVMVGRGGAVCVDTVLVARQD
ncbi:acetate--CoA ligase family protein [Streptosporangium sp. NPDC051022]|uniref:acetate--CoA ligase family protein n=1 Tax=Streptosporangium sp. NPDC051022 TaxID=3155752 RepID=UPI0034123943